MTGAFRSYESGAKMWNWNGDQRRSDGYRAVSNYAVDNKCIPSHN
jgi:hypothetical protein